MHALTTSTFDSALSDNAAPLAVVDFFATWCGPCKSLEATLEDVAERHPLVFVANVEIDSNTELANRFNIMSVPTVILFRDGHEVDRIVGARPSSAYDDALKRHS